MSIQLYSSPMKYKDPNTGNYIDIIGISGNPGRGISSVELNNDYTLTITFTDGTSTTTNSIRGAQGVGIQSVEKTNTSGLVDTYTITFDDNTISTFQVTNGASIDLHICAQGEYDSTTRVPTIQNPDSRTFYLVPNEDSAASNAYTEWLYANGAWERFGVQVATLEEVEEIITSYEEDEDMIFEMTFENLGHGEGRYVSTETTETIGNAYTAGKHVTLHFPAALNFSSSASECWASIIGANADEGKLYCNTVLNGQELTEIALGREQIEVYIFAQ